MTSFNVVCFKVKPGLEQKFLDAHKTDRGFAGFKGGSLIKITGCPSGVQPVHRSR